jgi:hypothetical protein
LPGESDSIFSKDILYARADAKQQCHLAIRFARRHRAQARLDLAAMMLGEAAFQRARFRYWHHRFVAQQKSAEAESRPQ